MVLKEDYFDGLEGHKIYYQQWLPKKPKAILQIIHGGVEHVGRYKHLIKYLIEKNITVYGNDHRGHGKSEGIRNHIMSFDDYVEDCYTLSEIIKENHKNIPLFVVGHSMGSLVAQRYALKYQKHLKGLILSGSGTKLPPLPRISQLMLKFIPKIWPTFKGPAGIKPEELSTDPESVEDYRTDPMINYKTATAGYGACFIRHYPEIKTKMHSLKLQILIQKGELDTMVIGLDELIEDLKGADLTVKYYPNALHEVYTEAKEKRESAFKDLVEWIDMVL